MSDSHKNDLFELIKSMTMSEKRYFKLFASRHTIGKKNNYVKFFEAIEKQKSYDEKKLKKTESYLSQYAVIKKNLYDLILKSLDAYNYHSSKEREIYNTLQHIEVLYNKGLYKQCQKLIDNASEDIKKTDRIRIEPILNNWKQKLFISQDYRSPDSQQIKLLEKQNDKTLYDLNQLEKLTITNLQLHNTIRIAGVVRDAKIKETIYRLFEKTTKHPPPAEENFLSTFYYYNIHYLYYYSLNDFRKAYEFIQKILLLFDTYPLHKHESNEQFLNTVFNRIGLENNLREFDKALESIKYLKTLKAVSIPLQNHLNFRLVVYELSIYCLSINLKAGYTRVKELDEFFSSPQINDISISTWHIIHYQAAFLCIGGKDFKLAIRFLNKIVNRHAQSESRNDIVRYSKILLLVCYYELGDTDHIEYAVKSVYRYLLKKEKLFAFEKAILKFVKKMPSLTKNDLTLKAFKTLKEELEQILKDPFERGAMEYFDFISWLESKIYKQPLEELIKEKLKSGKYA